VLTGFERFAALDRRTAQIMLDIFADQARSAALIGTRLICLVQADPETRPDPRDGAAATRKSGRTRQSRITRLLDVNVSVDKPHEDVDLVGRVHPYVDVEGWRHEQR
jgi:hypothetical protein